MRKLSLPLGGALLAAGLFAQGVQPPHTTLKVGDAAPDFLLKDTQGQGISLAQYKDKKIVVLVFNRGFT